MTPQEQADTDEFQEFVRDCCNKARNMVIGSGEYRLTFKWMDESHYTDSDNSCTSMTVDIDCVYGYATIRVYPESYEIWKIEDYGTIAANCLHEICHITMEPLAKAMQSDCRPSQKDTYRELVEMATERMAKSLHLASGKWWE